MRLGCKYEKVPGAKLRKHPEGKQNLSHKNFATLKEEEIDKFICQNTILILKNLYFELYTAQWFDFYVSRISKVESDVDFFVSCVTSINFQLSAFLSSVTNEMNFGHFSNTEKGKHTQKFVKKSG